MGWQLRVFRRGRGRLPGVSFALRWAARAALVPAVIGLGGCVTTTATEDSVQFKPMPLANAKSADVDPVATQDLRDLLDRARLAMEAANLAHEDGDETKALEQYTLMLELLAEANLDPNVFYSLRTEFESILETSTVQARAFERDPTLTWRQQATHLPSVRGLQYPTPLPERVLREIEEILSVYPGNFERGLARAAVYQPYIKQRFVEAGLPEDLVWLAMVESQYTPRIVSRAGAGGMWQFMRSTGRRYGLHVDEYVDERFDWKKSTDAAIGYLKDLHTMFEGEWPLAVSAYNMGEGGLERAIAANGGDRDLWALIEEPPAANRIRLETKKFYPKLLASAIVGKNPQRYGFNPDALPADDTVYVSVTGAYLLRDIEKAAGMPSGQLVKLNPHLLRNMTHPIRTVEIHVPSSYRASVEAALKTLPKLRPDTHVVARGETPSEIARLYGVSTNELMRTNNIKSARSLQVGQRLVIPGRMSSGPVVQVASDSDDARTVYRVRSGDSLSKIADRYNVSVRELQTWNSLGSRTRIHVGDRLYVAAPVEARAPKMAAAPAVAEFTDGSVTVVPASTSTVPEITELTHVVAPGDTAGEIADKYGVRLSNLLRWNDLTPRSVLQIGQRLKVIVDTDRLNELPVNGQAGNNGEIFTHTVQRGENPTTIARKYRVSLEDLYRANGWQKTPVIYAGQKITIKK